MRLGNGRGSTATTYDRTWQRWLTVLLAFLLAAAGLFLTTPRAEAAPTTDPGEIALNKRFLDWYDRDDVVHILVFDDDGRGHVGPAEVVAGDTVLFGFEYGGTLSPVPTINVMVDGGTPLDVSGSIQSDFVVPAASTAPAWQWDHDGDGPGDGNGNLIGDWVAGTTITFFRWESDPLTAGTHTFVFNTSDPASDTITVDVEDPCEEEDNCDFDPCDDGCEIAIEDDEGNDATFTCEDCTHAVVVSTQGPDEGDKATFDVDPGNNPKGTQYELVVTMAEREDSTPPGNAEVFIEDDENPLPKCKRNQSNCVVNIRRVKGGLTEYTVRYDTDPRFRFR
jgi:hypothetical protein